MKHLGSKAKIRVKLLTGLLVVMICLGVPALADGIIKSADLPMSYIYTPSGIALLAMIQWKWRHYDRIKEGIGFGYYLTKRFIDIVLALFFLLLSSPVSLVIAFLVYLEDDGPVIKIGKPPALLGDS